MTGAWVRRSRCQAGALYVSSNRTVTWVCARQLGSRSAARLLRVPRPLGSRRLHLGAGSWRRGGYPRGSARTSPRRVSTAGCCTMRALGQPWARWRLLPLRGPSTARLGASRARIGLWRRGATGSATWRLRRTWRSSRRAGLWWRRGCGLLRGSLAVLRQASARLSSHRRGLFGGKQCWRLAVGCSLRWRRSSTSSLAVGARRRLGAVLERLLGTLAADGREDVAVGP